MMSKTSGIFAIAGLLVCLSFTVPASQASDKCSLQTMAGTYAFYERGSSLIVDPSSRPFPVHWAGALAPFVTVGEITFTSGGSGEGFYWIRVGTLSGGLEPTPAHVTITEMNEDCTGKFKYSVTLPGAPVTTTVEERFIAFDNGREYRSIPSSIDANGVQTLAWIGYGRRISKPGEPVKSCGPQNVHGVYLASVENIVGVDATTAFADTLLLRLDISMSGNYTGMLYEKLGPVGNIQLPVWGTITINPDCSFSQVFNVVVQGNLVTIAIRGVFFNEGKELYLLAIDLDPTGVMSSVGQGVRISQ